MRLLSLWILLSLMGCASSPAIQEKLTWVELDDQFLPVLNEGTQLERAARIIRAKYPNLSDANKDSQEKWRDAHPGGSGLSHGELKGFGVTMVNHEGKEPDVSPEKIKFSDGNLEKPTLLFFKKGKTNKFKEWGIIGMGYSFEFTDSDGDGAADIPVINWDITEGITFLTRGHLIHEAGYHLVARRPGFRIAVADSLTDDANERNIEIDENGLNVVLLNDLRSNANHTGYRHSRIWAMHVWFEPGTGRPTVPPCDPWHRQSEKARLLPEGSFYYRNDSGSHASVHQVCENGGVYPVIAAQKPD